VIRHIAAFGAGVTLILVGAWCAVVKSWCANYDPEAFYE
jgi:hypothetical protein